MPMATAEKANLAKSEFLSSMSFPYFAVPHFVNADHARIK
jgi:hypothetical protein